MSSTAKQRISGIVSLLSAIAIVYCISRMIPYGLSGEVAKVKVWFSLLVGALVVVLPSGIAYYFYQRNQKGNGDLERQRIEINTLATMDQKSRESTAAATDRTSVTKPTRPSLEK